MRVDSLKRTLLRGAGMLRAERWLRNPSSLGAIIALHRVRPRTTESFQPNGHLEIAPEFLEAVIVHAKQSGFRFVSMDDVPKLLNGEFSERCLILTADDGYRDNIKYALPLLEKHEVPLTIYITTGFATRSASLWWIELEHIVRSAEGVFLELPTGGLNFKCGREDEKWHTFTCIRQAVRREKSNVILDEIAKLAASKGIDSKWWTDRNCLSADEIASLAKHELLTFGNHTRAHKILSHQSDEVVERELVEASVAIQDWIGKPCQHLAYPYGDFASAADREFRIAKDLGFRTGVTLRTGVLVPSLKDRLTSLPRLHLDGTDQNLKTFDLYASGAVERIKGVARK